MRGHIEIGVYCKGSEARAACIDDKELYNAYFDKKN